MTDKRAGELISQNLTSLYGFAFGRLYDKDKVEELTSDIIYEIMTSAENIKNDEAFWGYAWKIADHTFKKFIRREQMLSDMPDGSGDSFGVYEMSPEQKYIEAETESSQIYLLRRELSLLSKTHREVCVAYYVDNKSCSEISKEMNLSMDMVKYHLFKTRKLLKEGIGMTRTLGEKSYNPGTFRLNFWGDRNHYENLFNKKLPGAIALAAYHTPMTAEELSLELGVAMPYLEEELEGMEAAGVITKVGAKYQTNLVIITEAYEEEFEKKTKDIYHGVADRLWHMATAILPEVRRIDFYGNDYDDNRLLFAMMNMAMVHGYDRVKELSPIGVAPRLPLGSRGWIWGHDNPYKRLRFHGVCMQVWNRSNTAWLSAENYKAIEKAQVFEHSNFSDKIEAMCDAILENVPNRQNQALPYLIKNRFIECRDNRLYANFPVFDTESFNKIENIMHDISSEIADCMISVSDLAASTLEKHVPSRLREQCQAIAKIYHRLDVAACLMESLIEKGHLTVPSEKTPLCIFGVRKTK